MTWLNAFAPSCGPTRSYGNAANAVAALCSMVLWVLFGPTKVKRGQTTPVEWHPHLHMIALAEVEPSQERLSGVAPDHRG
jgi:hypothetical protein